MTEDTIRVGIVGAGKNTTKMHIPGLQAIADVEIVSVCNRSRLSSERVASQFNIPAIYENWWDLVIAPDTDAILIGTWPYLHCSVTLAALEAGKHVLCEARMAMNAEEATQMLAASKASPHLVTQVVPSPFTLHVDRAIKRLITEGYLGELLVIEVRANGDDFLDPESPLHWRQDADFSGLNVMNLGIWYEALMRWVGEANQVIAMGKTYVKMRRDLKSGFMKTISIPEHLNVVADMACGAQVSFSISNIAGLSDEDSAYLYGSEGTLCFADGKLYGGRKGDIELKEMVIPPEERRGWRVEEEFINAIRGIENVALTTFADGVKYMKFTEAVSQSIAERKAISVS
ncbi:MAG: Gfo/Idh/MocA family oxidoreductase [Anaerolineales bacterium]|nr:Gfo/Idh/MocA family oxidoreductase [Anaerolineales bacterium]MCK5314737.1 Gfo/Idh/MocA family oxidoreductase [Anaerolineales bacterium]